MQYACIVGVLVGTLRARVLLCVGGGEAGLSLTCLPMLRTVLFQRGLLSSLDLRICYTMFSSWEPAHLGMFVCLLVCLKNGKGC